MAKAGNILKEAAWITIDIATLDTATMNFYQNYKDAYKVMKDARLAFETQMAEQANLPQGQRMIFGYNFGKLSVAVVEDDRKVAKPKATTQSLSEFLASAKSHGDRT